MTDEKVLVFDGDLDKAVIYCAPIVEDQPIIAIETDQGIAVMSARTPEISEPVIVIQGVNEPIIIASRIISAEWTAVLNVTNPIPERKEFCSITQAYETGPWIGLKLVTTVTYYSTDGILKKPAYYTSPDQYLGYMLERYETPPDGAWGFSLVYFVSGFSKPTDNIHFGVPFDLNFSYNSSCWMGGMAVKTLEDTNWASAMVTFTIGSFTDFHFHVFMTQLGTITKPVVLKFTEPDWYVNPNIKSKTIIGKYDIIE